MTPTSETPLTAALRADIARRGPISFREFMARALYDSEHGSYASGHARLGREGDYFTSVSVGPLFGALLARQFAELWERLGAPGDFTLVEQGAHRGELTRDIRAALRRLAPECARATRSVIVEPFSALRAAQQEMLRDESVEWFGSVEELPPFTGAHFSNELLDAFPIHLVRSDGAAWSERFVEWRDDTFAFCDRPLHDPALLAQLPAPRELPPNYTTELRPAAADWAHAIAAKLARGIVLIIDYGHPRADYFAPHRTVGTLRACASHRVAPDPLAAPGTLDLTSHVEWTSLAAAAEAAGLRVHGFCDQHHFCVGLARAHFPDGIVPPPAEARAFQTLMHPDFLGRAFQVLALGKDLPPAPPLTGFHYASEPRRALGLA